MTHLEQVLESIILEMESHSIFKNGLSYDKADFHIYANQPDIMVTLHDVEHFRPIYINDNAKEFYGFEHNWLKGWDYLFYLKTVHPNTLYALVESVKFFSEQRTDFLNLTYKLKRKNGNWEIIYGCTKTVWSYPNGKAKYAISVTMEQEKLQPPKSNFNKEKEELSYLSPREKDILKCLAQDLSTKEIAEKLSLSEHTISTYRKNLIQKMGVNSSLGLVKYGLWLLENG